MPDEDLDEMDLSEEELDAMIAQGEAVAITGPPNPSATIQVELVNTGVGSFSWRVVTSQGQILAISASQYSDRTAALRALRALSGALPVAPVVDAHQHDDRMVS